MKLLFPFKALQKIFKRTRIDAVDQKQEMLVQVGREQFKKLLDKGLGVPVVLL